MNIYEWNKEDFTILKNSIWEDILMLLQSKKYNNINFNNVCIGDIIKIEELLKDCFLSAQDYIPNEQGFKQYIEDTIKYNSNKKEINFKDKIKVYIKEPNIPEYIQLWDKFDEESIELWCGERYVNHIISHDGSIKVCTKYPYNSKDNIIFRV